MSDHFIFLVLSVHMQASYITSARSLCSQDSKRLNLLFVDPLTLISGASYKLLWGKAQGRWMGEPYFGSLLSYCNSRANFQNECQPFI
jgi:hypothetical protein